MRILVVSQYYYPEPFRINEICEELVKRGNDVTVVTAVPNYPDGDVYAGYVNEDSDTRVNGVRVLHTKCRLRKKGTKNLALNYISIFFNLHRRLSRIKEKFDVVYTYQLSPVTSSLPGLWYANKHKIPSMLYCLDLWPESVISFLPSDGFIYSCMKKISKYVYKKATRISVTSPSFIDYLYNLCGKNSVQIECNPQHSRDLGILPKVDNYDCVNFVFLGNIGDSQRVDFSVRAIAAIKSHKNFKLHIVGSGSSLESVKLLARELHVEDNVCFYGRQPREKMPDYYKMADVCIVSLKDEGAIGYTIPGKLQEYMSAGKAILGSINGDASVVINSADCGLCSKADDLDGLISNMIYMIEHKDQLAKWGLNARKYFEEFFMLEKHVDTLEYGLRTIIKNQ